MKMFQEDEERDWLTSGANLGEGVNFLVLPTNMMKFQALKIILKLADYLTICDHNWVCSIMVLHDLLHHLI